MVDVDEHVAEEDGEENEADDFRIVHLVKLHLDELSFQPLCHFVDQLQSLLVNAHGLQHFLGF